MKAMLIVLVSLGLTFGMWGCAKKEKEPSEETNKEAVEKEAPEKDAVDEPEDDKPEAE